MRDPTIVAAAAFVDVSGVGAAYMSEMAERTFRTPDWNGKQVVSADVPLPVLLVSSQVVPEPVIAYWQDANATAPKAEDFQTGRVYRQNGSRHR